MAERIPQENWTTERINQNPPQGDLTLFGISSVQKYFGSWENLVNDFPGAAYKYAMDTNTPHLAEAFLNFYGHSQDLRFMKMSRDLIARLKKGSAPKSCLYYGSTRPDVYDTNSLNWRDQNSWDNVVSALEAVE